MVATKEIPADIVKTPIAETSKKAKARAKTVAAAVKSKEPPELPPLPEGSKVVVHVQPWRWFDGVKKATFADMTKFRILAEDVDGHRYLHPAIVGAAKAIELCEAIKKKRVIDVSKWERQEYPKFGSKADEDRFKTKQAKAKEDVKEKVS